MSVIRYYHVGEFVSLHIKTNYRLHEHAIAQSVDHKIIRCGKRASIVGAAAVSCLQIRRIHVLLNETACPIITVSTKNIQVKIITFLHTPVNIYSGVACTADRIITAVSIACPGLCTCII